MKIGGTCLLVGCLMLSACGGPDHGLARSQRPLEVQLREATTDTARSRILQLLATQLKPTDPDSALVLARQALEAARHSGDTATLFLAEETRAQVLIAKRDTAAVGLCLQLVAQRPKEQAPLARARALMWLGNAYSTFNHKLEADSVLALAAGLLAQQGDTALYRKTIADRMGVMGMTGHGEEAVALGLAQLAGLPAMDRSLVRARTMVNLASGYWYSGNADSAITWQKRAVLASESVGDAQLMMTALGNLAAMATATADYRQALQAQNWQAALAERHGNTLQLASSLISQGMTCDYMLRFDEALAAYGKGNRLADSLHADRLLLQGTIGRWLVVGKLDSAQCGKNGIAFHERNRQVLDALLPLRGRWAAMGVLQQEAALEQGIGDLYMLLHRPDSAGIFMEKAMAYNQAIGDSGGIGRASMGLGNVAYEQHRDAEAMTYYTGAMQAMQALGATEQIAFLHATMGEIDARNGRMAEAVGHLRQARELSEKLRSDSAATAIANLRAQFDFDRKQYADSVAHAHDLRLQRAQADARSADQRKTLVMVVLGGSWLFLAAGALFFVDRRRKKERYEKEAAMLETRALRAQMNPHFIFNALNSISAFIRQQEPEKAHGFIARFGKLMRLVLENSRKAEVPLARELEVLELYL